LYSSSPDWSSQGVLGRWIDKKLWLVTESPPVRFESFRACKASWTRRTPRGNPQDLTYRRGPTWPRLSPLRPNYLGTAIAGVLLSVLRSVEFRPVAVSVLLSSHWCQHLVGELLNGEVNDPCFGTVPLPRRVPRDAIATGPWGYSGAFFYVLKCAKVAKKNKE